MRNIQPGAAPGLLPTPDGPRAAADVTGVVYAYDAEQLTETRMQLCDVPPPGPDDKRTTWVRFTEVPPPPALAEFGSRWGLNPLFLEDTVNVGQRPKTEFSEDEVFAVLQMPQRDQYGDVAGRQVSLFYGPNYVVSVPEGGSPLFEGVTGRLRGGLATSRIRTLGASYLFYCLLDELVDHCFPLLDELDHQADELESSLLTDPEAVSLDTLYQLRRDITTLRRIQRPAGDAIQRLIRHDSTPMSPKVRAFLRDTYDHQASFIEAIEALRENTISLKELYLAHQGNRLNDVMKVLTIISTIFIPMSFITGLYGMNFDSSASRWNMPELGHAYGYPVVLVMLLLIAISMLVFFRRRGWL
jgi:magnesium transporter